MGQGVSSYKPIPWGVWPNNWNSPELTQLINDTQKSYNEVSKFNALTLTTKTWFMYKFPTINVSLFIKYGARQLFEQYA